MFLDPRTIRQVAALPYVWLDDRLEVLLITSRERGRWLLPKGWPSTNRSLADAARREAEEEAGVIGTMRDCCVGTYTYSKHMREGYAVPCTVFVYPLRVEQHRVKWPERSQRRLRWCAIDEAAGLVDDRSLGRLLSTLAEDGGSGLLPPGDNPAVDSGAAHAHIGP